MKTLSILISIFIFYSSSNLFAATPVSYIGVHNVDRNIPTQQIAELSNAGAQIVRSNAVAWHMIEKTAGVWDWVNGDYTVANATKSKMDVMFSLIAPPVWANNMPPYATGPAHLSMFKNMADWENYCRTVMLRYKGVVKYWEIWNEENAPTVWFKGGTPEDFVALTRAAYTIAKSIDPNNVVIMGGIVGPDAEVKYGGKNFFARTLQLGISDYIDVYAVHYTAAEWDKYVWFTGLIKKYGNPLKPIWNTEEDYRPGEVGNVSKSFLIDHYLQGMDKVFYYLAKDIVDAKGNLVYHGLFDLNNNQNPSMHELQKLSSFLSNSTYLGAENQGSNVVFYFSDTVQKRTLNMVVWNMYSDTYSLPKGISACQVTDASGKPLAAIAQQPVLFGSQPNFLSCNMDSGFNPQTLAGTQSSQTKLANLLRSITRKSNCNPRK